MNVLVHACSVTSVVSDSVILWTVAHQAPLSVGFSWQGYWRGLLCLPLEDLPNPGIEPMSPASPALQADSLLLSHQGSPLESHPHPFFFLSLVACHIFMSNFIRHAICVYAKSLLWCLTLCDPIPCSPPGSSVHGIFPDKNTGVGCHALLQGIFLTEWLNPRLLCLLPFRRILYHWATGEACIYVYPLFFWIYFPFRSPKTIE